MKNIYLLLLLCTTLLSKVEVSLSHTNIKHGTTFAVVLQSDTKLVAAPNAIFKNKTFQMFTIGGNTKKYEVFLPVDYHATKQEENIQVRYVKNNTLIKKNIAINIVDGNYRQNEIIKVSKGKVKLSKSNKKRSNNEYSKVYKNVYGVITQKNIAKKSTFQLPMNSKITSNFGNARIYNGIAKSYHSGTDFRAKVGTPISSANDGIVALAMDRFYLGKVVYVDHGRGAYTYYCHMNKINVKQGQKVKKGEVIGLSGKTGRITGPHLHYAVRLYNTTVDPIQYGNLYNNIIKNYH